MPRTVSLTSLSAVVDRVTFESAASTGVCAPDTANFPPKKKQGTPWSKVVLDQGEVFIARTPEEVRATFDDHALIFSLGIGSIMNVPIGYRGRRLGTMNISHEAGWFRDQDAAAGRLIASLLVPALLAN